MSLAIKNIPCLYLKLIYLYFCDIIEQSTSTIEDISSEPNHLEILIPTTILSETSTSTTTSTTTTTKLTTTTTQTTTTTSTATKTETSTSSSTTTTSTTPFITPKETDSLLFSVKNDEPEEGLIQEPNVVYENNDSADEEALQFYSEETSKCVVAKSNISSMSDFHDLTVESGSFIRVQCDEKSSYGFIFYECQSDGLLHLVNSTCTIIEVF